MNGILVKEANRLPQKLLPEPINPIKKNRIFVLVLISKYKLRIKHPN